MTGSTTKKILLEEVSNVLEYKADEEDQDDDPDDDPFLHASDLFAIAHHLDIRIDLWHSFVGPIALDGVAPIIAGSPGGRHHAIVNTSTLAAGGVHWVHLVWDKRNTRTGSVVQARILDTMGPNKYAKHVEKAVLDMSDTQTKLQLLPSLFTDWQIEQPLFMCGHYQIFMTPSVARQLKDGVALAKLQPEKMAESFMSVISTILAG